ncbi:response regulator [Nonlabens marinus]|uniref:Two-component response regulator n=1 Tax=Nonlabens marinus S1-08 TaxID=1454201 RepID=W8VMW8_9FLAO|nr:response regulator [Nonlabens marinus]BAO54099.1 two-component response regulator [Nonlabens marinus S1-08]
MSKKLIIIDDDPICCFILEKLLSKNGMHTVACFNNATKALQFLNESNAKTDYLIFLDLNMPVMDGWEFLKAMEHNDYDFEIDVAIVTSSIDPEDIKRAETYDSVISLITKPVTHEHLNKVLKTTSKSAIT